jgi:DNA-binding response OmpR family regulator
MTHYGQWSRGVPCGKLTITYNPIRDCPRRKGLVAPRILVLDDAPQLRSLITRALREDGYEVVEGNESDGALDGGREDGPSFDLIVTNSILGLSGDEVISRLRRNFPALPILHIEDVTHLRRPEDIPGGVPTLFKPFSLPGLRQAVRDLLA